MAFYVLLALSSEIWFAFHVTQSEFRDLDVIFL